MELYWRILCPSLFALLLWASPSVQRLHKNSHRRRPLCHGRWRYLSRAQKKKSFSEPNAAQWKESASISNRLSKTWKKTLVEKASKPVHWKSERLRLLSRRRKFSRSRRSFELGRPVFFVRIRARVDMGNLAEAIRRIQSLTSNSRNTFADSSRKITNCARSWKELQQQPIGVRMLTIDPNKKSGVYEQARAMLKLLSIHQACGTRSNSAPTPPCLMIAMSIR